MDSLTGPINTPSDCFTAQTIPQLFGNQDLNPDVGGAAVAISNIVINICLPMLLRWSNDDAIQTAVLMLLSQVYPIMIATVMSINTNNLSLFDAHFAVAVTASPVSVYLVYSSVHSFFGYNKLFKKPAQVADRMSLAKRSIRALGLFLPLIWLGVNLIISFSPHAFRNSPQNCQGMTIAGWFEFQTVSNFVGVLDVMGCRDLWNDLRDRGGLGTVSLITMWIWAIYVVRHRQDIYEHIQNQWEDQRNHGRHKNLFFKWFLAVSNIPLASWFVITKSHPWTIFVIVMCLHWSWTLGIVKGISMYNYQLSYGQILSIFSIIPPIFSVCKLLYLRKTSIGRCFRDLWEDFISGTRFLLTGSPNPWKIYLNTGSSSTSLQLDIEKGPIDSASLSSSNILKSALTLILDKYWWLVCVSCIVFNLSEIVWIYYYVEAGSRPNVRTRVNDPHSGWKPYSVSLYVFGYLVCYINILIWTSYYDKHIFDRRSLSNSNVRRILLHILRLLCLLLAFFMCAGPLFSPFAALPLAQQWQWSHRCDSFSGEAILRGVANPLQAPTLSFYYRTNTSAGLELKLSSEYGLIFNVSGRDYWQELVYDEASSLSSMRPNVTSIFYNTEVGTFEGYCSSSTITEICGTGNYSVHPYLAFTINDIQSNSQTQLRAQDKEWEFSNDAPSVVLKDQNVTDNRLGKVYLQSAVTQRDHCETLKVCLSSPVPDFATLASLGILLMAQDVYAEYCLKPQLYSI